MDDVRSMEKNEQRNINNRVTGGITNLRDRKTGKRQGMTVKGDGNKGRFKYVLRMMSIEDIVHNEMDTLGHTHDQSCIEK